ncbi:MAG: hypothetical protein HW375_381, partial [Anaerolineales bacterium]|nr:hypothetical protein [Anaerolineales bacterium]
MMTRRRLAFFLCLLAATALLAACN